MMADVSEYGALAWLCILATCALFALCVKKAGWVPYPTLFVLVVAIAQCVLLLVHDGVLTFDMLAVFGRGGLQKNHLVVQALYTGLALFSVVSLWGKYAQIKEVRIDPDTIVDASRSGWARFGTNVAMTLVVAHFVCYLAAMDWGLLWFHAKYLSSLANPDSIEIFGSMGVNTLVRTLLMAAGLSAVTFCVAANARRKGLKIIAGITTLCYFLLLFSAHSRSAVLLPVIVGMNAFVTKPDKRVWILPLTVFAVVFTLSGALDGRSSSAHGLSALPDSVSALFSGRIVENISKVLVNMSEGAFTMVESLQITQPFMDKYRVLALSPLPSFLDGYSNIRAIGEHRLHLYVPMSGYAEAILFGAPYAAALLAILFVASRLHANLAPVSPTLFLFCNFLQLFAMHYMFAYPMRNALRFVWLEILLAGLALLTLKRSAGRGAVAQVPSSGPRANVMRRKATIGIPVAPKHE